MICLRHWDSVVVVREGIRTNAKGVSILYTSHLLPFNVIMTTLRDFLYSFVSSNSYFFYLKLYFSFYFLFPEIFCWTCFPLCGGKANGGGIVCPQLPPIQCNSQTVTSSPSNSETNNPNMVNVFPSNHYTITNKLWDQQTQYITNMSKMWTLSFDMYRFSNIFHVFCTHSHPPLCFWIPIFKPLPGLIHYVHNHQLCMEIKRYSRDGIMRVWLPGSLPLSSL